MSKIVSVLEPQCRDELQRLSNLKRFNYRIRIHDESVAEHSFYVALYSMAICELLELGENITNRVLSQALIHDVCEIDTSDVPYPVKKNFPVIDDCLKKYEESFLRTYFPNTTRKMMKTTQHIISLVECIVKIADILSCRQYAEIEISFGNKKFFQEIYEDSNERLKIQFDILVGLLSIEHIPKRIILHDMLFGKED